MRVAIATMSEDLGVSSMIGMPVARMPRRVTRLRSEREGTHNTKLEKLVQFMKGQQLLITCLVASWRVTITNCFQPAPAHYSSKRLAFLRLPHTSPFSPDLMCLTHIPT